MADWDPWTALVKRTPAGPLILLTPSPISLYFGPMSPPPSPSPASPSSSSPSSVLPLLLPAVLVDWCPIPLPLIPYSLNKPDDVKRCSTLDTPRSIAQLQPADNVRLQTKANPSTSASLAIADDSCVHSQQLIPRLPLPSADQAPAFKSLVKPAPPGIVIERAASPETVGAHRPSPELVDLELTSADFVIKLTIPRIFAKLVSPDALAKLTPLETLDLFNSLVTTFPSVQIDSRSKCFDTSSSPSSRSRRHSSPIPVCPLTSSALILPFATDHMRERRTPQAHFNSLFMRDVYELQSGAAVDGGVPNDLLWPSSSPQLKAQASSPPLNSSRPAYTPMSADLRWAPPYAPHPHAPETQGASSSDTSPQHARQCEAPYGDGSFNIGSVGHDGRYLQGQYEHLEPLEQPAAYDHNMYVPPDGDAYYEAAPAFENYSLDYDYQQPHFGEMDGYRDAAEPTYLPSSPTIVQEQEHWSRGEHHPGDEQPVAEQFEAGQPEEVQQESPDLAPSKKKAMKGTFTAPKRKALPVPPLSDHDDVFSSTPPKRARASSDELEQWRVGKMPGHQGSHIRGTKRKDDVLFGVSCTLGKASPGACACSEPELNKQDVAATAERVLKKPFRPPRRRAPPPSDAPTSPTTTAAVTPSQAAPSSPLPPSSPPPAMPTSSPPSSRSTASRRHIKPFKTPVPARSDAPSPSSSVATSGHRGHPHGLGPQISALTTEAAMLRKVVGLLAHPEQEVALVERTMQWRDAGRVMVDRLFSLVPKPDVDEDAYGASDSLYPRAGAALPGLTDEEREFIRNAPADERGVPLDSNGRPIDESMYDDPDAVRKVLDMRSRLKSSGTEAVNVGPAVWDKVALMRRLGVDPSLYAWDEEQEDWEREEE